MGINASMRLREHVDILYGLLSALETIESEISCRLTPIPAALRSAMHAADDRGGKCREFLARCVDELNRRGPQDFQGVWRDSVAAVLDFLPEAEKLVLNELSGTLGKYDAAEQAASIGYIRRRLEIFLRSAEQERDRSGRVYTTLGVTMGIAVVIVLI